MNSFEVLLRPRLSEKAHEMRERERKYVFLVHPESNKRDVSAAISKLYNVKPTKVTMMVQRGKIKRRGMHLSLPRNFKKAIVTLPEGAKLPVFFDEK